MRSPGMARRAAAAGRMAAVAGAVVRCRGPSRASTRRGPAAAGRRCAAGRRAARSGRRCRSPSRVRPRRHRVTGDAAGRCRCGRPPEAPARARDERVVAAGLAATVRVAGAWRTPTGRWSPVGSPADAGLAALGGGSVRGGLGALRGRRPQPDRLGALRAVGLEPGDGLHRDRPAEQLLDRLEERLLVDAHERDRLPVDAGAAGAADPVDVVLGDHRQLEVDDVRAAARCRCRARPRRSRRAGRRGRP